MAIDRPRIALVGCGDVAKRHYVPALSELADRARVVAVVDPRPDAAREVVALVEPWSPAVAVFGELAPMLDTGGVDAVIDLVPAPRHAAVNQAALDAGLHLYSEKPLAATLADADRLIATADAAGVLLLCAPGVAATHRSRWLADLARSGRYGRPTLVVGHHADPGPAAWREYTGDPTPFYREGVGPLIDHGVYRLHLMTAVLGPVVRVQAMGTIGVPTRVVRGGPLAGQRIEVSTPDHVLVHLEFASGALGQLLASYGTASTLAPWLELHLERATVSFGGESYDKDAPVSIYGDDDSPAATEHWEHDVEVPTDDLGVLEAGVRHFVDCPRGEATPLLTAEHARHVLDIIVKTYASIGDGAAQVTETTF